MQSGTNYDERTTEGRASKALDALKDDAKKRATHLYNELLHVRMEAMSDHEIVMLIWEHAFKEGRKAQDAYNTHFGVYL